MSREEIARRRMAKKIAVIAGDIHYSLNNLELADKATRMAICKSNELEVPFIANGDTHDQKANLRAECVNAMIEAFKTAIITPYVNIGNHCKINNKGEAHALNFLRPYAKIIEKIEYVKDLGFYIIPYHDNPDDLRNFFKNRTPGKFIVHQGLEKANKGDYVQDKSAINHKDVENHLVIASHYHARQTIGLSRGRWEYIGSPYTQSFGEANDPEKGFQILYDDGSLEFIPTNLRKHVVLDCIFEDRQLLMPMEKKINKEDLVWVKITGTREEIANGYTKQGIAKNEYFRNIGENFKLTYEFTDQDIRQVKSGGNITQPELLDSIIDNIEGTEEYKQRLKKKWRDL